MKGQMIVLADIAASTLGIALFVMVLTLVFQGATLPAPALRSVQGEVSMVFKTTTAPPLRADQIVDALYARTAAAGPSQVSVDVFQDRVDVVEKLPDGSARTVSMQRIAQDLFAELHNTLGQKAKDPKVIKLFVFSNGLYNFVFDTLHKTDIKLVVIPLPVALKAQPAGAPQDWHPDFKRLIRTAQSKEAFVIALKTLLERPIVRRHTSPTDARQSRSSLSKPREPIFGRLLKLLNISLAVAVLGGTGFIIRRVENSNQNKRASSQ